MPRIALITLILLPLLFASLAPVLAQETASSTEAVNYTGGFELPTSPADEFIKKWLIEGKLKAKVQGWMNDTQTGLQDAAEQALSNAQQAAKDEITRQADQTIQGALEKAETYAGRAVAFIKRNTYILFSKIILFFNNLFFQN